ncbi:hypothetical protein HFN68_32600 [Rhizobium laguerreae]|uniref:hypothetical protein n=1 Tax=Rhizobium laguerreae TaxID=1076926 RepID=UPI001C92312D|nr:hypothetical protein [Rhizobium laguerreae]MBY3537586.1 hypothetical protein [Rhizobium laguerreae]
MVRQLHVKLGVLLCSALSGCGAIVPSLEELPTSRDEPLLVQSVVSSIHCELTSAVYEFIQADKANMKRNRNRRNAAWFDDWGVQVALTLSVQEKTSVNPSAIWTPPSRGSSSFLLSGGVSGSTEASRINKSNYFYTVKQLHQHGPCKGEQPKSGSGSPLIQNDLKVGDWLFDQMPSSATNEIVYPTSADGAFGQNVLSHEVKFEVITSGGLTPAWTLSRISINPDGRLLNASRNRVSDLIVTFGPLDPKQNNKGLTAEAENVHFVQQLGLATSTRPEVRFSLF